MQSRVVATTGRTLGCVGLLVLVQALLVAAFVLPGHKPQPHDVPIGVVGNAPLVQALERQDPGSWEAKRYASASAARRAIDEREVYGAFVGERRVLIASAASATVAGMLRQAAEQLPNASVTDVKPLAAEDPRGSTLNLIFLPLIIACSPAVLVLSARCRRTPELIGVLALLAVLGGAAVIGLVGVGLDALPGPYVTLSAVAALTILAVALPTADLTRLIGPPGLGIAVAVFAFVGNPASVNAGAPELLPGFWRAISQFMPPGAGGTSLRNTAYFDGNAVLRPILVLVTYAVAGAVLVSIGDMVRRRRTPTVRDDAPAEPDELRRAA